MGSKGPAKRTARCTESYPRNGVEMPTMMIDKIRGGLPNLSKRCRGERGRDALAEQIAPAPRPTGILPRPAPRGEQDLRAIAKQRETVRKTW